MNLQIEQNFNLGFPQNIINSNNNNMSNPKVFNHLTNRWVRLFQHGTKRINQSVKKAIKANINNIKLPYGYAINKCSRRVLPILTTKG